MLAFIVWSSIWSMVYICHVFFFNWRVSVSIFSVYRISARRPLISTTITVHVLIFIYVVMLCCSSISQRTSGCWNEQLLGAGLSQFFIADEKNKISVLFLFHSIFFFLFGDKLWFTTTSHLRTWLNTIWSLMCKNSLANLSGLIRYTNRKNNVCFML